MYARNIRLIPTASVREYILWTTLCILYVERTAATHPLRRALALPHTAMHCRTLPIALQHTAARIARIARSTLLRALRALRALLCLLPNIAKHRSTHCRTPPRALSHTSSCAHCRTLLHIAGQPHTAARTAIHYQAHCRILSCAAMRTATQWLHCCLYCRILLHCRTAAHCRAHCHTLPSTLPHTAVGTATHSGSYCRTIPLCRTSTDSIRRFISFHINSHKFILQTYIKNIIINLNKFT
jgi:hypothetical protein